MGGQDVPRRKVLEGFGVLGLVVVGVAYMDDQEAGGAPATAAPAPAPRAPVVAARELLAHDRLELDPRARGDLEADILDPNLLALLGELLARHRLAVSVFATGHSKCVAGSNSVSHHWYGAAMDVWKVDGRPVDGSNRAALAIVHALIGRGEGRPRQVGHPFAIPENRLQGVWTDRAHGDHLHLSTWTGPNERAQDCA